MSAPLTVLHNIWKKENLAQTKSIYCKLKLTETHRALTDLAQSEVTLTKKSLISRVRKSKIKKIDTIINTTVNIF